MQREWGWWIKISITMSNIEGWTEKCEHKLKNIGWMCCTVS
jgi:hypothetical protein